jgi:hypothetical protein
MFRHIKEREKNMHCAGSVDSVLTYCPLYAEYVIELTVMKVYLCSFHTGLLYGKMGSTSLVSDNEKEDIS